MQPVSPIRKLAALSIQTRVVILVAAMAAAMAIAAVGTQALTHRQASYLSKRVQSDRASFYGSLLDLRGARMKALAFDYTYWDEMVTFVNNRNHTWAANNLDSALATYDVDCLWIYNPAMQSVYSKVGDESRDLKAPPFLPGAIDSLKKTGPYYHFFIQTSDGLMEVRGATIHHSDDAAHDGPALGYFFVGRIWDTDYLHELGGMTSSHVTIHKEAAGGLARHKAKMEYDSEMVGWDGKKVATLSLVSDDPVTALFERSSRKFLLVVGTFALLVLGLVALCLFKWVSRPLSLLSKALAQQSLSAVGDLVHDQAEMGRLAALIGQFFEQKTQLQASHELLEIRVAERTEELAESNRKLRAAYDATIEGWSRALDLRDHETEGHSRRVTEMTLILARSFGLSDDDLLDIERGALLHDIGKMGVPDNILLKPGPLTDDEWAVMRKHPQYAFDMLQPIAFLSHALDIPYCHHEKWDGTGYPRGIRDEQIPFAARLFAVADVWDALVSDRPYRRGWPIHKVREHFMTLSGTHFDPAVVTQLIKLTDEIESEPPMLRAA